MVPLKYNIQIDDQCHGAPTAPTVVSSHLGLITTSASCPETLAASGSDTFKENILTQLGISIHLADCTDCGLHVVYEKYKAHLGTC